MKFLLLPSLPSPSPNTGECCLPFSTPGFGRFLPLCGPFILQLKCQDCEITPSVLGPRKEHGSSLTLLNFHLILLNSWNTSFPREEADLLHQNNSARDNQNDSSFYILKVWAKYWCLHSLRVLLFTVSSNLLPWVFPIKAMLYYNVYTGDPHVTSCPHIWALKLS